jgi:hypothetical protein
MRLIRCGNMKEKKQRSKKTIKLKIIDSDTINTHYNQLKAAEEKRLAKKKISRRKKGEKATISGEEN